MVTFLLQLSKLVRNSHNLLTDRLILIDFCLCCSEAVRHQDDSAIHRRKNVFASGQGDLVWDRMQFDEQWQLLMKSLWDYQYTKNSCPLDENLRLSKVLYEETQGITDLAVKLFMFAQERAITSEEEKLSASIIRSAARDKFNLLQPALKAFREKDKAALADFEDAYPEFLKVVLLEKTSQQQIKGEIVEAPEFKILLPSEPENQTESGAEKNLIAAETQQAITDFSIMPILN